MPAARLWTWSKERLKGHEAAAKAVQGGRSSAAAGLLPASAAAWHRRVYFNLSLAVTAAYALTRSVLMPLSVLDVAAFLFTAPPPDGGGGGGGGAAAIQATPSLAWVWVHCAVGCLGSVAWTRMLITGYLKFRAKAAVARRKAAEKAKKQM